MIANQEIEIEYGNEYLFNGKARTKHNCIGGQDIFIGYFFLRVALTKMVKKFKPMDARVYMDNAKEQIGPRGQENKSSIKMTPSQDKQNYQPMTCLSAVWVVTPWMAS